MPLIQHSRGLCSKILEVPGQPSLHNKCEVSQGKILSQNKITTKIGSACLCPLRGSADKAWCQAYQPEFDLWDPHSREAEDPLQQAVFLSPYASLDIYKSNLI